MNDKLFTMTVRFRTDRDEDRAALDYLKNTGKTKYGSLNQAVIAAVNGFAEKGSSPSPDPYLESHEKEDAFFRRVQETVEQAMQRSALGVLSLLPLAQPNQGAPVEAASSPAGENEEDLDLSMEFIGGL